MRADQIHHSEGKNGVSWFRSDDADAEAGFGGTLKCLRADEVDDRGGRGLRTF